MVFFIFTKYLIEYTLSKQCRPAEQMPQNVASDQQVCTVCISPTKRTLGNYMGKKDFSPLQENLTFGKMIYFLMSG